MTTYKDLYYHLFNALTDAIEELEQGHSVAAMNRMKQAQLQTEEEVMAVDILPLD